VDQITITATGGLIGPALSAKLEEGALVLAWKSEATVPYVIEYTDDLGRLPWVELQKATGTGETLSLSLPAAGTRRFYRVRASQ
jgi:hypothetical protein